MSLEAVAWDMELEMTPREPGPQDGAPPRTKAIDRSVLGEWLDGDDAAIDELLTVFRDSVRAEQAKMAGLLPSGDLEHFANAAHRLRGAALSMGARAVAEIAGTLYDAAKAGETATCVSGMASLAAHLTQMAAEVPTGSDDAAP
jgi:HPt (histidine-containing phosphotransfer) domain-containing protein